MLSRKNLVVAVAVAATLSACTAKNSETKPGYSKITIDSNGILKDSSLSATDKAEKLALAAEQLMTVYSFMYANDVADTALTLDANNKRAQLIKVLVGPAMETKGILERIKPIANRNEKSLAEYDRAITDLNKQPDGALKTFLFNGAQDIRTEKDAQSFVARVQGAFSRLRIWLKDNKNLELTLNIPAEYTKEMIQQQVRECTAEQIETGVYELECDFKQAMKLKVNQADLEAAQQIVAGTEIYMNFMNAYDLSGTIAVSDKYAGDVQNPSTKTVINELLQNKEFGVLRDGQGLKNILAMGLDAVAGIRYAQKLHATLCPKGVAAPGSRKGYVFRTGLCVDQDSKELGDGSGQYKTFGDLMKTIEVALRGGNITTTFKGRLGEIETEIKPSAIFSNPIANVRSLSPTRYDRCGKIIGTIDNTLGGVFVNGDANAVLLLNKDNCQN